MKVLLTVTIAAIVLAACGGKESSSANDALLVTTVKAKLASVDVDSTTTVNVQASNGAVTLTGDAHTESERLAYSEAARSVAGVRSVDDRLSVNPGLRGLRGKSQDAELAARVSTAIAAQAGINVFQIGTAARDGTVTLRGKVPTPSVERTVIDAARGVNGVKRVVSQIVVAR